MVSELPAGRRKRPLAADADRRDAVDRLTRVAAPAASPGGWTPPRRPATGRHTRSASVEATDEDSVDADDDHAEPGVEEWDEPSPRPSPILRLAVRFGVTRRQVLLVLVLAVVACAFAALQAYQHRARVTDVPVTTVAVSTPAGSISAPTAAAPTVAAMVVVHVVGRVARPGVVRLPIGSRVKDAVAAAGGPARGADLTTLNLARVLADGEQIAVGDTSAGPPAASTAAPTATAGQLPGAGPVNLNTATLAELDSLPHIGPVLAQRILDFRTQHGRFTSVDELNQVTGIGEKTFADLQPLVTV
jgi:competence protein ComEA